ncbi:50S ribosomal protein L11 methyltransferase [uncultured Rhodospira sp.]|uniref:50S ribosomal protein L11 methyltransferase n=1 Tax=uncultured Rhodospira sp. TaxID=1936189 RepID=UPI00260AB191|nr:50S ribosomal protein L11 methyltransferase [uncultured Rhodospira sp.]
MADTWRIEVVVPAAAEPAFEAALDGLCDALLCFEIDTPGPRPGLWRLEGLCERAPDPARLSTAVALAARAAGIAEPPVSVERLGPRDWLAENLTSFPPLDIGRFHLRGSHVTDPPPPGRHTLIVDAATAFGSGEHPTTRGCLLALDDLARRGRSARVLDMGCGTGVLALAAAAQWRCPVLAVDNDAESVRVARHNVRRNGLAAWVRGLRSDGFRDARVRAAGPYDLILANILARPLAGMSRSAAAALAPGGRIVLSGLLATQEARVATAYRRQGLALERRYPIEEWMTLVMRRPARS